MQRWSSLRVLRVLGWVAAGLYLAVGVAEVVVDDDRAGRALFLAVLTGLAACVVGGIHIIARHPWPRVALASVGALLGGIALFWTVLAIPLALAIVWFGVKSAWTARREATIRSTFL